MIQWLYQPVAGFNQEIIHITCSNQPWPDWTRVRKLDLTLKLKNTFTTTCRNQTSKSFGKKGKQQHEENKNDIKFVELKLDYTTLAHINCLSMHSGKHASEIETTQNQKLHMHVKASTLELG